MLYGRQATLSSVGMDEEIIKKYVEHQGRQDSGQLSIQL